MLQMCFQLSAIKRNADVSAGLNCSEFCDCQQSNDQIDMYMDDHETEDKKMIVKVSQKMITSFFYKQSIFDPHPENCLSFFKKLPQKIV